MHKMGGRKNDPKSDDPSWFPGRPADAPEPEKGKAPKLPKDVEGHSLGGRKKK